MVLPCLRSVKVDSEVLRCRNLLSLSLKLENQTPPLQPNHVKHCTPIELYLLTQNHANQNRHYSTELDVSFASGVSVMLNPKPRTNHTSAKSSQPRDGQPQKRRPLRVYPTSNRSLPFGPEQLNPHPNRIQKALRKNRVREPSV